MEKQPEKKQNHSFLLSFLPFFERPPIAPKRAQAFSRETKQKLPGLLTGQTKQRRISPENFMRPRNSFAKSFFRNHFLQP
jgi:hypothetical protein